MRALLDRLMGGILALIMGSMTLLVLVSVVRRYLLNNPMTWSEECAQMLFAWLTFLGAYVGFRSRSHIVIDTLLIYLPVAVRRALSRSVDLCVLVLLGLMVWKGFSLVQTTWSLEFPAMEISRGYLYLSLPVGAGLMVLAILLSWRAGCEKLEGRP